MSSLVISMYLYYACDSRQVVMFQTHIRQVCIWTDTRGNNFIKYFSGVTASVDKSVCATAKSYLFLLFCI